MGFIDSITMCTAPTFTFPSPSQPGLPNFLTGVLASCMAGINYVLDFIPPSPSNLPSPPSIDLFLSAFMGAVSMPSSYPGFSFGPITIPGVGSPPYPYDATGQLKLITACVILPFQLITDIITGIINDLTVKLPTLSGIQALISSLFAGVGLPVDVAVTFGGCLAHAVFDLFTSLIPV